MVLSALIASIVSLGTHVPLTSHCLWLPMSSAVPPFSVFSLPEVQHMVSSMLRSTKSQIECHLISEACPSHLSYQCYVLIELSSVTCQLGRIIFQVNIGTAVIQIFKLFNTYMYISLSFGATVAFLQ